MSADAKTTDSRFVWRFGNAEFDPEPWQLWVDGAPVELERRPLQVLQCLLRHANQVVSKEELLRAAWPSEYVSDNALSNAVGKLRRALGERASQCIETRHGIGYRIVDVRKHGLEEAAAGMNAPNTQPQGSPQADTGPVQQDTPGRRASYIAAILTVCLVATGLWLLLRDAGSPPGNAGTATQSASSPAPAQPSRQAIDPAYQRLTDRELAKPLAGKVVEFKATYLGLSRHRGLYEQHGIETEGHVYLRHRAPGYRSSATPLGSSDIELSPFILEWPTHDVSALHGLKKYQVIQVVGVLHLTDHSNPLARVTSFAQVRVEASEISGQ